MSHVATVACQIKDLEALAEAAANKGGELMLNQQKFKSYQPNQRCDHAIRLKGQADAYEVGVQRMIGADDVFELKFDDYGTAGRPLTEAFGRGMVGLSNEYQVVVAERKLAEGRYRFEREAVEGDPLAIRLVARR